MSDGAVPHLYRSKPQMVLAIQWTGDNYQAVDAFTVDSDGNGRVTPDRDQVLHLLAGKNGAQGWVPVPVGHWVVCRPDDLTDFWPVDPDYFVGKYEQAINPPTYKAGELDDIAIGSADG